ncbi:MAG: hypothetical protein KGL39_29000 [Patescibacteria group bacterium]|nr:hypothetical protein [Patescibacteria group bacterium]
MGARVSSSARVIAKAGGRQKAIKVVLADESVAVFKPDKSERRGMRLGIEAGQQAERELTAWRLAKLVGMRDMVAPVKRAIVNGVSGVLSYWQPGVTAIQAAGQKFGDSVAELARAAAFDYAIGNTDRHRSNWLLHDGHIKLIDHGLSFPEVRFRISGEWRKRRLLCAVTQLEKRGTLRGHSPEWAMQPYMEQRDAIRRLLFEKSALPEPAVNGVWIRIHRLARTEKWEALWQREK